VRHKDYYKILGVDHNATRDEIQDAFHALARKYHPDINPDPQVVERFKEISAAYEVLSDPEDRAKYDLQIGADWRRRQQASSRSSDTAWRQQPAYDRRAGATWYHKWSRTQSEPSRKKHQNALMGTTIARVGIILIIATLIINSIIDVIDPSIKSVSIRWESCVIILLFVAGVGSLGWGLRLRRRSKCPGCRKPWAREVLRKEKRGVFYRDILLDGLPPIFHVRYRM
jgi:hypothetical protein